MFINSYPSLGIQILENPTTHIESLFYSIIISQILISQSFTARFSLSIHTSPYFLGKLKDLSNYKLKTVTLYPVYIKSISQTSSFISHSEYVCRACCESFIVPNDLTWSNTIQTPSKCRAFKVPSLARSKEISIQSNCEGIAFDLLESTVVYSDYQEFIASDGKNEVVVIIQAGLCNTLRIGECVEITGIYTQRWNVHNESEYAFVCLHLFIQPSSIVKAGISTFKNSFYKNSDFEVRESIIRSSFSGIYGNYHIKLGLILNIIGHLSGFSFSTLVLGDISTGKSKLSKQLIRLFKAQCRLINGALTNPKAFSQLKIMNISTGKYESGLLDSDYVLVIDNFQCLLDKKILYKAMETRSVIAMVETDSKNKEFVPEISKNIKLPSESDRFDIILYMKNYDNSNDFRVKILGNYSIEDYSNLWDFDTIKEYLYSNLKPQTEIKIISPKVQNLFQSFITYIVSYNLKHCDMPVASGVSVRLLESLIKISKANAILLGHSEVTLNDAIDALVLLNCNDTPEAFVDVEAYNRVVNELLNNVQQCVGELGI